MLFAMFYMHLDKDELVCRLKKLHSILLRSRNSLSCKLWVHEETQGVMLTLQPAELPIFSPLVSRGQAIKVNEDNLHRAATENFDKRKRR